MSGRIQRPEHLLIREYVERLRDSRVITQEELRDAFVPMYIEMIPPGDDAPSFEPVHRYDTPEQMRKKDQANLKKLWRAIDGTTFFPLAFKAPLIEALEKLQHGLGVELQKLLLHNAGLYHLPIDTHDKAPLIYSELLQEFAEANSQIVADMADDGVLNSERTRKEVLDSLEKHLQLLREIDRNREQ